MSERSYDEIFADFEEITNSYNRKNQYFDILYDSTSKTSISKTPASEDFSISTNKSGYVARTFNDTWEEFAFESRDGLKFVEKNLPKVKNMGDNIATYEGWKLNKSFPSGLLQFTQNLTKQKGFEMKKTLDDMIGDNYRMYYETRGGKQMMYKDF